MKSTLTIKGIVLTLCLSVKSLLIDNDEPPTGSANAYNKPKEYYEEKQGKKFNWEKMFKPFKPVDNLNTQLA